ncbi:MAG: CPBP family intramembrane metalloprotease [Solobacterium sp.]|nr:CPBP family intramembrane metalloprotease [Solobacterium sp.]
MAKKTTVISKRRAKRQINTLGIALIIYILLQSLFRFGASILAEEYPQIFMGYDPELVTLCFTMFMMVFTALVPFRICANKLDLDISDYMKNPKISLLRLISLACIGIGLMLVVTAIPSIFYIMVRTNRMPFEFIGDFTTKNNILKNFIYFLLIVIVKPVLDEVIFRGIIQRQLGHYGRYFGVLASSFLYALSCMTISDALPSFFFGWYLAAITLRYHSLRPGIFIHICTSLFSWSISVIPDTWILLPTVIIVIVYLIAALTLFNRKVHIPMINAAAFSRKLWQILLSSWSVTVCMIMFAVNAVLSFFL